MSAPPGEKAHAPSKCQRGLRLRTESPSLAVQIVYSSHSGSQDIEHIGSAQDDVQVGVLKAAAWQRMAAGQGELELGLERTEPGPEVARGHSATGNASRDRRFPLTTLASRHLMGRRRRQARAS